MLNLAKLSFFETPCSTRLTIWNNLTRHLVHLASGWDNLTWQELEEKLKVHWGILAPQSSPESGSALQRLYEMVSIFGYNSMTLFKIKDNTSAKGVWLFCKGDKGLLNEIRPKEREKTGSLKLRLYLLVWWRNPPIGIS